MAKNSTQRDKTLLQTSLIFLTIGATVVTTGIIARAEQRANAAPTIEDLSLDPNSVLLEALPTLVPTPTYTLAPTATPMPAVPTSTLALPTATFIPTDPVVTNTVATAVPIVQPTATAVPRQQSDARGQSSR